LPGLSTWCHKLSHHTDHHFSMLRFSEQDALESWLQRCPMDASGITYGVTCTGDGKLSVSLECRWQMVPSTSADQPRHEASSSSGGNGVQAASSPLVSSAEEPLAAQHLREQLAKMQTMIAAVSPRTEGDTPPGEGAGAALAAAFARQSAAARQGGPGAPTQTAESIRAMLGTSLGMSFPKPPGRDFSSKSRADASSRVVEVVTPAPAPAAVSTDAGSMTGAATVEAAGGA
jgi:hypothetical protein